MTKQPDEMTLVETIEAITELAARAMSKASVIMSTYPTPGPPSHVPQSGAGAGDGSGDE